MPVSERCTPCTLETVGDFVRVCIHSKTTKNKHSIGIFRSRALCQLKRNHGIVMNGSVCSRQSLDVLRENSLVASCTSHTLRIVIYGFMDTKIEVARLLSEEGRFLRDPSQADLDLTDNPSLVYFNPQYLLLPGVIVLSVAELSTTSCYMLGGGIHLGLSVPPMSSNMRMPTESQTKNMLNVFNSASAGGDVPTNVQQSSRISTKLKR